jgi:hypothetical protein
MLSDQLRQLLTAYVDGELTSRQRKALQLLLRRSSEARQLLRQLQEDARRLRTLPRQRLGEEFTARVVRAVQQRQADGTRRPAARPAAFPVWAGFAAAAAILVVVGLGSFVYFARPTPGIQVASTGRPPDGPATDQATGPKEDIEDEDTTSVAISRPATPGPSPTEKLPMPAVADDRPKDRVRPGDLVTQETPLPGLEMFKPSVVKLPFSLLQDVRDIRADHLRKALGAETALRIELPCADTARGFRRLQNALKEVGITLAIDAAALNRIEKPRLRSNYALLVEDLTAEELARALARVGSDDKKAAEARTKPDGQFSKMVVNRLTDADRKELSEVLHVEARLLQPGAGKGKGTERLALAVTYNPEQGRPRPNSPEVKRYLETRKADRAGAVQVLLVLRETPR